MTHQELEDLFVENLPLIERVVRHVSVRNGLKHDEEEELTSLVHTKMIASGYEIFAKFEGRSSLESYLVVVVSRVLLDYRRSLWGRWRPSPAARREGGVAVRLEQLLFRDELTLDEACETLLQDAELGKTRQQLEEIAARLPQRLRTRVFSLEERPVDVAGMDDPEGDLVASEEDAYDRHAAEVLLQCLNQLPGEDRLIVRLRYLDGLTIADIARTLELEQRPLYRRMERILGQLRKLLTDAGVDPQVVLAGDGGLRSRGPGSRSSVPRDVGGVR